MNTNPETITARDLSIQDAEFEGYSIPEIFAICDEHAREAAIESHWRAHRFGY